MKTATLRRYRQDARAAAAAATGTRILDAFIELAGERWLDEATLDEVARRAGVTVQTVIRRFGGKEGLLEASADRVGQLVRAERATPPGRIGEGIAALVRDYEKTGDTIVRLLAQEQRYAPLKQLLDIGRKGHREWLEELFAPALGDLAGAERERRIAALILVTDVYAWQLLRRDQGRGVAETVAIIEGAARAIVGRTEA